ncbi:hypothetical protein F4808DRAFT_471185 [Astrocystis sublimbata]|nr:hypothetical protein F4808DRAFT_471185 [Astrocystis sublimbata]
MLCEISGHSSMHTSLTQRTGPSYRAVPYAQDDALTEDYALTDYRSSRNSTGHHPADVPLLPTPSCDSDAGSTTRAGHVVRDRIQDCSNPNVSGTRLTWLPYMLRWPTLVAILAFTAALGVIVVIVHAISASHKGLVADDGSGSLIILSKFIPTLLAVIHGILLTMLLNDVKRTQPFANLASSSGALAGQSLTWVADTWWECLVASLPKRNIKKTSWAMLCTSVAFIFSFLIVSPFSSTLLVSKDVLFVEERAFSQLNISSALPLRAHPVGTTCFRTVSNLLQNVTTSAWITDSRAILPFWPSTINDAPLGPILTDSAQTWLAKTTVFDVEMECEQMKLVEFVSFDLYHAEGNFTTSSKRARLLSLSGCSLTITLTEGGALYATGGAVWSGLRGTSANATVLGQICKTNFFMGYPTVTVTLSKSASSVEIDESVYSSIRKPIPDTVADSSSFQRVFLNTTNWSMHLKKPVGSPRAFASGPAIMLSALYDYSPEKMVADSYFLQNAGRVKQRFFGELLRDVFDTASGSDAIKTTGTTSETKRRVVVVPSVAIILEISLVLQFILLSTVLVTTRISRRPLGLFADPAPPIRVAKLISNQPDTLKSLEYLHGTSSKDLALSLSDKRYLLSQGRIHLASTKGGPNDMSSSQESHSPQPSLLNASGAEKQSYTFSLWVFIVLLFLLSAVLTVIAYLYWYSDAVGLYQTAFVYAFNISFGGLDLGDVNPASLLTTLVAVIIGLWWGSLDTALRRIQPYLILAKKPITKSRSEGVLISYVSSYLLLAAWRAFKRTHWVLALVCTGAFLSEILTIAMSSLWAREAGALPLVVDVPRQLELRQVPRLSAGEEQFTSHAGNYKKTVLSDLFENMRTSWIYGAAVQISLEGSEPPWSSGGWSFVPYDLSLIPSTTLQNTGNKTAAPKYPTNATVDTIAIRARLECSPYEYLDLEDSKTWLTEWDLTDTTQWGRNTSTELSRGFELGLSGKGYNSIGDENVLLYLDERPDVQGNYSTFFVNNKRFQCCENRTEDGTINSGSVGYWSPNLRNSSFYPDFADTWPANFTVKWIHGRPIEGYCGIVDTFGCLPRLLWIEKPRMAALNCMPVIETADATVTVNAADGNVLGFTLRGEPRPDDYAWSDDFKQHKYDDSVGGFKINITTSHGVLFLTALLGAADLDEVVGTNLNYLFTESESIEDQTFNIRQPGLNADLMTYSMLSLVDYDHEALLDLDTLTSTAQQTFTALFQHFASNNVSFTSGGYVFQPPGEKLPSDLDGPVTKSPRADDAALLYETVVMNLSRSVELLKISKPAAYICLSILVYLIIAGVTLTIVSRGYPSVLRRRINSIADVAVLMAGSQRLLGLAREKAINNLTLDPGTRVRLGWFNNANGTRRWGIEVVDKGEQEGLVSDDTPPRSDASYFGTGNEVYTMAPEFGSAQLENEELVYIAPTLAPYI